MKHIIVFLSALLMLTACVSPAEDVPTIEIVDTEIPETDSNTIIQTDIPQKTAIDITNFQVSIGDVTCRLNQIPIDGGYYISECDQELILPINQAVTVMLIPPDDAEYVLMELFDRLDMVEILFHDALIAYFRDGNIPNQTDFVIPFSETSGEDVICGFSIMLDKEVTILVKGTAQR